MASRPRATGMPMRLLAVCTALARYVVRVHASLQRMPVAAHRRGRALNVGALPWLDVPPEFGRPQKATSGRKSIGGSSDTASPVDWNVPPANLPVGLDAARQRVFTDLWGFIYTTVAGVGTPELRCSLIVDTGSSDLWVKASHKNLSQSHTAKMFNHSKVHMSYGSGQVDGIRMEDEVCLGTVCIYNQSFVLAQQVRGIGNDAFFDGLMGLAFPALAEADGKTYLEDLMQEKFDNLAIGLSLQPPRADAASTSGGTLTVGQLEEVKSDAEAVTAGQKGTKLSVLTVDGAAYWWVIQTDVHIGMRKQFAKPAHAAMLDSGTSLITVPRADFQDAIDALVPCPECHGCSFNVPSFEGFLVCPCDTATNPLTFTFGDEDTGASLSVSLGRDDLLVLVGVAYGDKLRTCLVKLAPAPSTMDGMSMWILGDPFLQKVYTVHDVRHRQIVLYPHATGLPWPFTAFDPIRIWLEVHGVTVDIRRLCTALVLWLLAFLVCTYSQYFHGRRPAQRVAPIDAHHDDGHARGGGYARF